MRCFSSKNRGGGEFGQLDCFGVLSGVYKGGKLEIPRGGGEGNRWFCAICF